MSSQASVMLRSAPEVTSDTLTVELVDALLQTDEVCADLHLRLQMIYVADTLEVKSTGGRAYFAKACELINARRKS